MAGVLSFSRQDAVALPLTMQTVEDVIARTRTASLVQLLLSVLTVAGFLLVGRNAAGWLSGLGYSAAALAMWALLATALSAWDHFRTAAPLREKAPGDMARHPDPVKFWRAQRGLFPYFPR